MDRKVIDICITFIVFIGIIIVGNIMINTLPIGYTEASILYLAGIVGAGLYWVGRKR